MVRQNYERLSAQDQSFLVMENPTTHMHVVSVNLFEAGPLKTADGGINVDLYKKAIESVLHLVPRYRQRLAWTPIENRPVWVDDPQFNLDYHIRHSALPRPGSDEQLKRLASRISAQQLDRARPLWEMWVVEGLQGDRFATINKIHHCMLDGVSGMDLAQILFSPTPDYEIQDAPRYVPHAAPSGWEMLRDSVTRHIRLPIGIIRGVRTFRRETEDLKGELLLRVRAVGDLIGYTAVPAQDTPLNGPIGPHRRLDWLKMPLAHFKMLSKALECTVNDVVLATVAGGVREYMLSRRVHPEDIEFRTSAPVSVRRPEERGRLGNRVSSWIVALPIGEANARKRLEAIKRATKDLKTSQQALGVEMMMAVMEWTPTMLMSLGMRAAGSAANMIVTNVPGPQQPLYLLGARLLAIYPVVPLLENTGLSIGLVSLAGNVCWGFNADYELVPDLPKFAKMIEHSCRKLGEAAGVDLTATPRGVPAREVIQLRSSNGGRHGKRKHSAAVPAARGTRKEDQPTVQ